MSNDKKTMTPEAAARIHSAEAKLQGGGDDAPKIESGVFTFIYTFIFTRIVA